jgi:hypothetical protein
MQEAGPAAVGEINSSLQTISDSRGHREPGFIVPEGVENHRSWN